MRQSRKDAFALSLAVLMLLAGGSLAAQAPSGEAAEPWLHPYAGPTRTDIDASVGYYGVGVERHVAEADKLADPLLLHIAEEDQFVPKEAQALIVASLKNHPQVEIYSYPGRDHAFARVGGEHYDAADTATANARTLALFKRALA